MAKLSIGPGVSWGEIIAYILMGIAGFILLTRQDDLQDLRHHLAMTEHRAACLEMVVGAMQKGARPEASGRLCPNGE